MPEDEAGSLTPLTTQMLAVGDGHRLYVETVGRADGTPVVYLHGGPGSGCQPAHRRLFDPTRSRAVLFDQRGCGRSMPFRSRVANTTTDLIADMEAIRTALRIDRWLVVGGSWGATLALAYAQTHPERVSGIVLRATFLGTREELEWAFLGAMPRFYPRLHADFLGLLDPAEQACPLDAYWRRILDPDPSIYRPAAWAWHDAERILSQIAPPSDRLDLAARMEGTDPIPSTPFMEAHYFSHECFLAPGQLMRQANNLRGIRGRIIQGRYDLLCPPQTAYALAALWPEARVIPIAGAGHGLTEPGIQQAMRKAINELGA